MNFRFFADPVRFRSSSPWFVLWCLRLVVALQCIGIAGRYVLSANETESDVYGLLFFDWHVSEVTAKLVDDIGAYGCLVAAMMLMGNGLVVAVFRLDSRAVFSRISTAVDFCALLFVAVWSLTMAASHSIRGDLYAELTLGEHAVRIAIPIVLLLLRLESRHPSIRLKLVASWLLKLGIALTFAVHGYKAMQKFGPFVDLMLLTDMKWFELDLEQATAETWLLVIGWIDVGLAGLLLFQRWRWVVVYMVCWGLITALSRMTAMGTMAWPETLIRAANWGGPLVLFLIYRTSISSKSDEPGVSN